MLRTLGNLEDPALLESKPWEILVPLDSVSDSKQTAPHWPGSGLPLIEPRQHRMGKETQSALTRQGQILGAQQQMPTPGLLRVSQHSLVELD